MKKISLSNKIATIAVLIPLIALLLQIFGNGGSSNQNHKKHPLVISANSGNVDAMTELAINYKKGIGGLPLNAQLAKDWHIKAANLGQPKSQQALGVMHAQGLDSTNKDTEEAMKWFGKSAMQGNLGAIANIDVLYRQGKISDKDWIKYMKIAANKGEKIYIEGLIGYYIKIQDFDNVEYWAEKLPEGSFAYQLAFFNISSHNQDGEEVKRFACLMLNNANVDKEFIAFLNVLRERLARESLSCY